MQNYKKKLERDYKKVLKRNEVAKRHQEKLHLG